MCEFHSGVELDPSTGTHLLQRERESERAREHLNILYLQDWYLEVDIWGLLVYSNAHWLKFLFKPWGFG